MASEKIAKIGRNEPCLCGSGIKYKKCCSAHRKGSPKQSHCGMIDLYNHPDIYDKVVQGDIRSDILFYLAEVSSSSQPVLEVTSGTGRLTIPLAQSGVDITGLDLSEPMIKRAQEKIKQAGVQIPFVHADATQFQLNRKFGTIMVPASGLLFLDSIKSIEQFLVCAKNHLLPNGKLIFDIVPPTSPLLALAKDDKAPVSSYELPNKDKVDITEQDWHYDAAEKLFCYSISYFNVTQGQESRKDTYTLRIYELDQIRDLLNKHGFSIVHEYGDYLKNPVHADSLDHVIIAKV